MDHDEATGTRQATSGAMREEALRATFDARHAALFPPGSAPERRRELSRPLPRDRRGMLVGDAADSDHPSVDVVVCARDAPEATRACLWSLLHEATRPFHLIVVDDGCGPETAALLGQLARREPEIELIRNEGPEHGDAAATALARRAATGAHVVLLGGDAVVASGWLERVVARAAPEGEAGVLVPEPWELRDPAIPAGEDEAAAIDAFRAATREPLQVLFVLHAVADDADAVEAVCGQAAGLLRLGVPARVAIGAGDLEWAKALLPDAGLVVPYSDEADLAEHAAAAGVVVAADPAAVAVVGSLRDLGGDFLPAYRVQDYEPFFADAGSSRLVEALDSFTAVPGQLVFAETHWLRNVIGQLHGVDVALMAPALDRATFTADGREERAKGPVRIASPVVPRDPRRQPALTLDLLADLAAEHGDQVEVTTFGCSPAELAELGRRLPGTHLGRLTGDRRAALLRRSDVFLDASLFSAVGRTALEAMACGCAPVAPQIGGAAQFVRDGENGLLADTLCAGAARATVDRLVGDPGLRRQLQAAATREAAGRSPRQTALSQYALFARAAGARL